jgi:hypothetical protein
MFKPGCSFLKFKRMSNPELRLIYKGLSGSVITLLFIVCMTVITVFSASETMAQGNLLIMPRRVVFEGAKKSQELTLANAGTDSATYVVSFVQMKMKEDGSFEQITTPDSGQYFSDKYFRIFPRTVNLAPKESQVVKMQLNKASNMAPGEYRSHIYFRSVPKPKPLGETSITDTTAVSVRLVPIFGITIPAIIRVGECSGKVDISDVSIEIVNDSITRIKMKLNRTGNVSFYGDMTVNYTSPNGEVTRVLAIKGIAVYTPNRFRTFQCDLNKNNGIDYHAGKINVLYTAPEDVKSAKLAEAELLLH